MELPRGWANYPRGSFRIMCGQQILFKRPPAKKDFKFSPSLDAKSCLDSLEAQAMCGVISSRRLS